MSDFTSDHILAEYARLNELNWDGKHFCRICEKNRDINFEGCARRGCPFVESLDWRDLGNDDENVAE